MQRSSFVPRTCFAGSPLTTAPHLLTVARACAGCGWRCCSDTKIAKAQANRSRQDLLQTRAFGESSPNHQEGTSLFRRLALPSLHNIKTTLGIHISLSLQHRLLNLDRVSEGLKILAAPSRCVCVLVYFYNTAVADPTYQIPASTFCSTLI